MIAKNIPQPILTFVPEIVNLALGSLCIDSIFYNYEVTNCPRKILFQENLRHEFQQRRRREIFVESSAKNFSSSVGATSFGNFSKYAAPTELKHFWVLVLQICRAYGAGRIPTGFNHSARRSRISSVNAGLIDEFLSGFSICKIFVPWCLCG